MTYSLGARPFPDRGEKVCRLRKGNVVDTRNEIFAENWGKRNKNEQIIPGSCTNLGDVRRELNHLMCDASRNDPNNCNSGQCDRIRPAHDDHNYSDHRRSSRQRAGRHSACGRDRDSISVQISGRCDRSSGVVTTGRVGRTDAARTLQSAGGRKMARFRLRVMIAIAAIKE